MFAPRFRTPLLCRSLPQAQAPGVRYRSRGAGIGDESGNRCCDCAASSPSRGAEASGRCSLGTGCLCEPSGVTPFSVWPLAFPPVGDREYVRSIKEQYCYVALDFDKEKAKTDSPSYAQKVQLPDGQEVTLGQEKFFCPEVLFRADLMGEWWEGARGGPRCTQ